MKRYRLGVNNPSSKLDALMVRAIRTSTEAGTVLAERYQVTTATICHIRKRITWKHVA